MSGFAQYEADQNDGSNVDGPSSGQQPSFAEQLRNILNTIPAYTWYAVRSGGLAFVNERCADYLGLPRNHPLRLGTHTRAEWDSLIALPRNYCAFGVGTIEAVVGRPESLGCRMCNKSVG